MADMISLNDGNLETIFDLRDFMELIDSRLGFEAARWLEEYLAKYDEYDAYVTDLEDEMSKLREHHREVMKGLRERSETIAGLVQKKTIDRKAISTAAGEIGAVTWREMNT